MEKKYCLENFETVWNRVMTQEQEKTEVYSENETTGQDREMAVLKEFIINEMQDADYYKSLAKKCTNKNIKRLFCQLSQDESAHLSQLQTNYFLKNGDIVAPQIQMKDATSLLLAIQSRYMEELNGAKAYLQEAEKTEDDRLRDLYSEFAVQERGHAERLYMTALCLLR